MSVLRALGFNEADRRQLAFAYRNVKIVEVILMLGLIGLTNGSCRAWREVMLVGAQLVIHERFMMRNIGARGSREAGRYTGPAWRSICESGGRSEPALKPTPRDVLGVQQVANILAAHPDARLLRGTDNRCGNAIVKFRTRISDDCA